MKGMKNKKKDMKKIMEKEDEVKNKLVTLKNMKTGEQNTIKIEEAIEIINSNK